MRKITDQPDTALPAPYGSAAEEPPSVSPEELRQHARQLLDSVANDFEEMAGLARQFADDTHGALDELESMHRDGDVRLSLHWFEEVGLACAIVRNITPALERAFKLVGDARSVELTDDRGAA